jgi:protein SCO1/2
MTFVVCLCTSAVYAHRFGGPNDPCERKIGTSFVHITFYQTQFDPDAEYCNELPRAGKTVLVVDILGDNLRALPLTVEVLSHESNSRPVIFVPAKVYRRGVADAVITLDGGEVYTTRLKLGERNAQQTFLFELRVAPWYHPLMTPGLLALAVVSLLGVSIVRYRRTIIGKRAALDLLDNKSMPRVMLLATERGRPSKSAFLSSFVFILALTSVLALSGCHWGLSERDSSLPDVQVIDDHGNPISLGSLKGKIVLLDFIHVGCPGVCSELVNKFGQIADELGPELGSKVILLSVTNDPIHDNPAELLKLARSSQADMKGWLFVTGKPDIIARVITAFGLSNDRLQDGSPNHITQVFLLGQDGRQRQEYQGLVMDSSIVASQIRSTVEREGAL